MRMNGAHALGGPLASHRSTGDSLAYLHLTDVLGTSNHAVLHGVVRDLECDKAPQVCESLTTLAHQRFQRIQLTSLLEDLFGALDAATLDDFEMEASLVPLARGAILYRQGEAGEYIYIVISGRLQMTVADHGQERVVGEVGRGESVGEMALFTGEHHYANVVASSD